MTILQWLCKIANRADDIFVSVEAEWEDGDEAKGEPRIALYDVCGIIAAVVTLAYYAFIALEL